MLITKEHLELLPEDFNPITYLRLNPDLDEAVKNASQIEKETFAENHYLIHGKKEKRIYLESLPEDFNPITYLRLNPDLDEAVKNASQIEKETFAENHYLIHGKKEKRIYLESLPEDFNPIIYIRKYLNHKRKIQQNNLNLKLNSKKKAYIHIGYGKTGSTSIQNFFYQNYDILKDNKILYPLKAHHKDKIATIGKEEEKSYKQNIISVYTPIINNMLEIDHNSILISSEYFIDTSIRVLPFLKELFHDYDINIIFYIRNQSELIKSVFLQEAQEGRYLFGKTPWDMYTKIANHFDFNNLIISSWEKIFGCSSIKASLYHPEITGSDVRFHFLKQIGLDDTDLISKLNFESEQSNPSIHSLLSGLLMNIDQNEKLDNRSEIIKELLNISKHLKGIKNSLFTPQQEAEIKNYYAESNTAFADKYLTLREKELLLS